MVSDSAFIRPETSAAPGDGQLFKFHVSVDVDAAAYAAVRPAKPLARVHGAGELKICGFAVLLDFANAGNRHLFGGNAAAELCGAADAHFAASTVARLEEPETRTLFAVKVLRIFRCRKSVWRRRFRPKKSCFRRLKSSFFLPYLSPHSKINWLSIRVNVREISFRERE